MIATVLLCAGVLFLVIGALGVLVMHEPLDRLHYVGLGVPGALLIAAAVLARESFSLIGGRAILVAVLMLTTSPVLTHATARVIHARQKT